MAHHVLQHEYPDAIAYTAEPTTEYSFSDTSILHRYPFLKQHAEHINDLVSRMFLQELLEKQRIEQEHQKHQVRNHLRSVFGNRPDTPIPYTKPFIDVQCAEPWYQLLRPQQEAYQEKTDQKQNENDLVTDIQLPFELHTDHLSDEQEAWLFTHAIGAIAYQLNMSDKTLSDFTPNEIEQIADYMRRFFAIDVHVMPVIQQNNQKTYAQFKFTRITPPDRIDLLVKTTDMEDEKKEEEEMECTEWGHNDPYFFSN